MRNTPGGFKGFVLYVVPLIGYCGLLFYISSLPRPPMPDLGLDWGDKLQHALAFFIMACLAYRSAFWLFPNKRTGTLLLIGVVFASLYGATDELHQYFVPERSADIYDWIADTVGAMFVVPAVLLAAKWWKGSLHFYHSKRL